MSGSLMNILLKSRKKRKCIKNARTYDKVISNRRGQPKGRIANEEATKEEARKEAEQ
jgi:hypothetical protein